ncbi:hypothetical protein [Mycolicibacterium mengxianglii]|uniref:hypothetical protein n=1 Tax=Mycolicibacterium mengxianglii TaxID=2736649 RepID=UPI0018D02BB7|nr:hypothetical protein [Mycolicibacterium mengxianglii]
MQIDDGLLKAWKSRNSKTGAAGASHYDLLGVLKGGVSAAEVGRLLEDGLSGSDISRWFNTTIPFADWAEWISAGVSPDSAVKYRDIGVAPAVAREWAPTGLDFREVGAFVGRGYTIEQALAEYVEPFRIDAPVSSNYAPLEWGEGDDVDELSAWSDDWTYSITAVRRDDDTIIGYRISGGDVESGDDFGSSLIDGERGERTLEEAKAAAQADYSGRYREADQFLDDLLGDWEDDGNPMTRRNDQGRIVCRVDEPGIDEVEVVSTLVDYGDGYDAKSRIVSVCLRTLLSFSHNGDSYGLVDDIHRIIRLQLRRGDDSEAAGGVEE